MYRVVTILFLLLIAGFSQAQTFTLQQAIDTAIANNIPVKQSDLLMQAAGVNWKQSRLNRLPDLNSNINHGINQGRSIDPFTNAPVTQQINYASYGISSGVLLFNGMNLNSQVKQNAYAYEASKMEWQQEKDNLTLNVILAYLQVLNNDEIVNSSLAQAALSQKQLERLQIMDSVGAISPSLVSDLKGQLMGDQLAIINARNALETAKLALAQLMNVPYSKNMRLEKINVKEMLTAYSADPNTIYQNALQQFALIKSVDLRKQSARYALKATKGQLFPSLFFSGNYGTNYSSVAQNASGKISYRDQLNNNVSSTYNLGLSIPIFNALSTRNRIKLADITLKNAELVEENTKQVLRQQIEQAHLNMTNAFERYQTLMEQVEAYTQSFKAAEVRFNSGVGTSIDYLTAKNNLDRANINMISAQYDFALRKKILDYYQNIKTN
jgi:outer membrane protein